MQSSFPKKVVISIFCMALVAVLFGCDGQDGSAPTAASPTATPKTARQGVSSSPALDVPYISQWERRKECGDDCKGWNNCGPASLAMAIEYFHKRPVGMSDPEFIAWTLKKMTGREDSCRNGFTVMNDIQTACKDEEIGLQSERLYAVDNIQEAVAQDKLVICAVNAKKLKPSQYYSQDIVSGDSRHHIILVRGFGTLNGREVVYVNDPLSNLSGTCPSDNSFETAGPSYYTFESWQEAVEAEASAGRLQAVAVWRERIKGVTAQTTEAPAVDTTGYVIERVSVASDGTQGNDWSDHPSISADGRFVAFVSLASNLVAGDSNGTWDVFVRDRQAGTTERVSVARDGTPGNSWANDLNISADGRFVAFGSHASNLVAGDTHDRQDVFVAKVESVKTDF